jgi:hypothetical protein
MRLVNLAHATSYRARLRHSGEEHALGFGAFTHDRWRACDFCGWLAG